MKLTQSMGKHFNLGAIRGSGTGTQGGKKSSGFIPGRRKGRRGEERRGVGRYVGVSVWSWGWNEGVKCSWAPG